MPDAFQRSSASGMYHSLPSAAVHHHTVYHLIFIKVTIWWQNERTSKQYNRLYEKYYMLSGDDKEFAKCFFVNLKFIFDVIKGKPVEIRNTTRII